MHIQSTLCWYRDKSSILSIRTSFTRKCSCRWGKLELLNATTMRRCAQCPCGEGALGCERSVKIKKLETTKINQN